MIVRPPQNWFRMLFAWKGSVLRDIIPQLVFMAVVSGLAVLTDGRVLGEKIPLNAVPFTLCGVALTIFLAFRNNASYDRYWEARKMWGNMLIAARTLASQALCYAAPMDGAFDGVAFARGIVALAYTLKHQLRGTCPAPDLRRLLPIRAVVALADKQYKPVAQLNALRAALAASHRRMGITGTQLWMLDGQLDRLGEVVGGCERIASTPIPFAYGVLLHRTVYAYCMLLPFGLVDSIGMATPLISIFVSYTLIALEAIASDIAEPFGLAPNNLALDAMTNGIERSLLELCELELPAEATPVRPYQLT
ncbi:bestrophin family protein [Cupriavidus sp. 30B13]|uniref:bestrophin family protein n=1 Tax=Cupriavidus sp. 30B13 TaxID=3384241 RepID=UPI003B8F9DD0